MANIILLSQLRNASNFILCRDTVNKKPGYLSRFCVENEMSTTHPVSAYYGSIKPFHYTRMTNLRKQIVTRIREIKIL